MSAKPSIKKTTAVLAQSIEKMIEANDLQLKLVTIKKHGEVRFAHFVHKNRELIVPIVIPPMVEEPRPDHPDFKLVAIATIKSAALLAIQKPKP